MRTAALLSLVLLSACAMPTSRTPVVDPVSSLVERFEQKAIVRQERRRRAMLRHHLADDDYGRLYAIGYPILEANIELCPGKVVSDVGLQLFELPPRPAVAPGSPADAAGIDDDDRIAAIQGVAADDPVAANARIATLAATGRPLEVTVQGADGLRRLTLVPRPRCDFEIELVDRNGIGASADGYRISFTRHMLLWAADDNHLALVFGHELAHNALGHMDKRRENQNTGAAIGKVLSVLAGEDVSGRLAANGGRMFTRAFEREADYVGVYLAARAGFDVSRVAEFWRKMALLDPMAINQANSHPTTADRFIAVERAAAEVADKRRRSLPLVPDGW